MDSYVLAIDQGTTSSRAIIFDHAGQVVAVGQREHEQLFPQAGWVEHDPVEIWDNVRQVIGVALARAGINRHQLAGVGITNQRETTARARSGVSHDWPQGYLRRNRVAVAPHVHDFVADHDELRAVVGERLDDGRAVGGEVESHGVREGADGEIGGERVGDDLDEGEPQDGGGVPGGGVQEDVVRVSVAAGVVVGDQRVGVHVVGVGRDVRGDLGGIGSGEGVGSGVGAGDGAGLGGVRPPHAGVGVDARGVRGRTGRRGAEPGAVGDPEF